MLIRVWSLLTVIVISAILVYWWWGCEGGAASRHHVISSVIVEVLAREWCGSIMMDKILEAMLGQAITIGRWRRWRSYLYHFHGGIAVKWLPLGERGSFCMCSEYASKSSCQAGSALIAKRLKISLEELLAVPQWWCRRSLKIWLSCLPSPTVWTTKASLTSYWGRRSLVERKRKLELELQKLNGWTLSSVKMIV